jgi:hypothetical protein
MDVTDEGHMRNPHLYPNLQRVNQLLLTMTGFFAVQPDVYEVLVFGSLVTDDYDRWSDLDMLVVTATAEQQRPLFEKLKKTHPMHYHRVFMRDSVSSGSYVSGCTFVGESVFHTLDLNFMDLAERQSPGSLDRFGEIRQLHYMMTIPPATIAPQHVAQSPSPRKPCMRRCCTTRSTRHVRRSGARSAHTPSTMSNC